MTMPDGSRQFHRGHQKLRRKRHLAGEWGGGMPTRFASLSPLHRWLVLGLTLVAIAVLAWAAAQPVPTVSGDFAGPTEGDLVSYQRIIERMRGGESYYPAAH